MTDSLNENIPNLEVGQEVYLIDADPVTVSFKVIKYNPGQKRYVVSINIDHAKGLNLQFQGSVKHIEGLEKFKEDRLAGERLVDLLVIRCLDNKFKFTQGEIEIEDDSDTVQTIKLINIKVDKDERLVSGEMDLIENQIVIDKKSLDSLVGMNVHDFLNMFIETRGYEDLLLEFGFIEP